MENNDQKLQNVIQNFKSLDWDEQEKLEAHIDSIWVKAHQEYVDMCSEDKELCEAYDQLAKAKSIMSFDWADHYNKYVATENGFDPENSRDIYEFDPDEVENAKYISEHLEEVNSPLQEKLEKLNKQLADVKAELDKVEKRGGMFKRIQIAALKSRMNELESEITSVQVDIKRNIHAAEHYQNCLQRQAEKEKYIQNYATLVEPYKKIYQERTQKYANAVVEKYLESDPYIVCKNHTANMTGNRKRGFSSEPLNKVCNEKRNQVLSDLKRAKGVEKV